jgi:GlpG protein
MRLIGSVESESQASKFSSFLMNEKILCKYESYSDPTSHQTKYRVWVENEDDYDVASSLLEAYLQNPEDPRFQIDILAFVPPHPNESQKSIEEPKVEVKKRFYPLTYFILFVCTVLFIWNGMQEAQLAKRVGEIAPEMCYTPLMQELLFDYPHTYEVRDQIIESSSLQNVKNLKDLPADVKLKLKQADSIPCWNGLFDLLLSEKNHETKGHPVLFEKIRQGEVWRLFTPCLMHANLLHILFNMLWVLVLAKQIEDRLKKWKFVILMLLIGVISNIIQYFISGPAFLGFSGIVVGLVGFIWMRQKKAPWEGYPLQRAVVVFIVVFVGAMFALELFSFMLKFFSGTKASANIANTAHIIGGLVGVALGRMKFFSRGIA